MPKLPIETFARNLEILQKPIWKTGAEGPVKKNPVFDKKPIFSSNHMRLAGVLIVVVVLLTGFYFAANGLKPSLFKKISRTDQAQKTKEFEYPVNVAEIQFPTDLLHDQFLENFNKSKVTKDDNERYVLLENNFTLLLSVYAQTQGYDYRIQLSKFKDYMRQNYPQKYELNTKLYNFACVDELCGKKNISQDAEDLKNDLKNNKAINPIVRDGILRQIDSAVRDKDKTSQGDTYVNILSSIFSEYKRTKDEGLMNIYNKLNGFISKNFTEIKIPEGIKI